MRPDNERMQHTWHVRFLSQTCAVQHKKLRHRVPETLSHAINRLDRQAGRRGRTPVSFRSFVANK